MFISISPLKTELSNPTLSIRDIISYTRTNIRTFANIPTELEVPTSPHAQHSKKVINRTLTKLPTLNLKNMTPNDQGPGTRNHPVRSV